MVQTDYPSFTTTEEYNGTGWTVEPIHKFRYSQMELEHKQQLSQFGAIVDLLIQNKQLAHYNGKIMDIWWKDEYTV